MPANTLSAPSVAKDRDFTYRTVEDAPRGDRPSDRFLAANREWFPGLGALGAETVTRVLPKFAPPPTPARKPAAKREAPEAATDRSSARAAMANREWFPGLCRTCAKRQGCVFPVPEGGVFSCDEFE